MTTLDEIQARADAASTGPWKLWGMTVMDDPHGNFNVDESRDIAHTFDPDRGLRTFNAEFIRAAREDVPKLVGALRAVEAALTEEAASMRVTSNRLNQQMIDRHHDRDPAAASRYDANAIQELADAYAWTPEDQMAKALAHQQHRGTGPAPEPLRMRGRTNRYKEKG